MKHFLIIGVVGALLSLLQAWGSIVLNDIGGFHPFDWRRYDHIVNEQVRGQGLGYLRDHREITYGLGPMNEFGHAWWFSHKYYDANVESLFCSYVSGKRKQVQWSSKLWGDLASTAPPPSWSVSSNQVVETSNSSFGAMYEVIAGWPMQSWYGAIRWENEVDKGDYKWSFSYTKLRANDPSILPFRPMAGIWINALFYGGIAYLFGLGINRSFLFARRVVRIGRSQCTNCAYNISGLAACPECGQPVETKQP